VSNVIERFTAAGVPKENIAFERGTFRFEFAGTPAEYVDLFRRYYGPTMNAFDAAETNGRADDLRRELVELAETKNESKEATSIPATFLRVTVSV
jgi:hypothetical protein